MARDETSSAISTANVPQSLVRKVFHCSLLDDAGSSVELAPLIILALSTLQLPHLHHPTPRYQISIQPVWHCLTYHLFHAPLYFANDAWRCNVANLTALPMLKGYSPLIKAEVHPFIASSSPLIVLGVSQPECCSDN